MPLLDTLNDALRRGAPRGAAAALASALLLAGPAAAGITGVCPDGSMYIVKRAADIPCPNSKRVDPNDMPPIRPQYLPRPYGWEKFQRKNDPNNPYNLVVEKPAPTPELATPGPEATPAPLPEVGSAPPPSPQHAAMLPPAPAVAPAGPLLDLTDDELRDLALIVELSQRKTPAALTRGAPDGSDILVLRFARSPAFETVLRSAWTGPQRLGNGPVLLFSASALQATPFHANLAFVQSHVAFHPQKTDPRQFELLRGELGNMAPDETSIGYVVLPDGFDVAEPFDIYWNDRRLTARLYP